MVPKIAGKGQSFKGAGAYYLHDKGGAKTSNRVAFARTANVPTENPELALRFMAHTAINQAEIKAINGSAKTGRKLTKSVYAYSLSWSPDEQPSQEEMLEAAQQTLELLDLKDHEAIMVSHNDEPHPHLHVIVNRVHPETGIAAKLSKDRLKLSEWAEKYERQQGEIRCEQRVENNKKRREGQFVKDNKSYDIASYQRWRKDRLKHAFEKQQQGQLELSAKQKDQRSALYDEKELRIEHRRRQIKEAYKPHWAKLYQRQKKERAEMSSAQEKAFSRLWYWMKHRPKGEKSFIAGAVKALFARSPVNKELTDKHEAQRKALAKEIARQNRESIRLENEAHRRELEELKKIQEIETRTLKDKHTKESRDIDREIKERLDDERFMDEGTPNVKEEFKKRVGERRKKRKRKERDERGKGHGRERE